MAIQVGDKIPDVTLKRLGDGGMEDVSTGTLFAGKTVALFAVPGAFTPTCSDHHLPGFVQHAAALKAKGVEEIVCMAVNDPFVMKAWGEQLGAVDYMTLLPDGNGEFTKALDLGMDASGVGLGYRSQRFAIVAKDGVATHVAVEPERGVTVSSAESVLAAL